MSALPPGQVPPAEEVPRFAQALPRRPDRRRAAGVATVAAFCFLSLGVLGTGLTWAPLGAGHGPAARPAPEGGVQGEPTAGQLRREIRDLESALRAKAPHRVYVVVDSPNKRLYLRRGDKVLLEAICSTGSGLALKQVDADRQWIFDTPRGIFTIRRKDVNPVWVRPDWAFLEDGMPPPHRREDRLEYGSLGEYGLYFGDGYIIHGTLYENLLGRNVTHGCIRLGRNDLKEVYSMCPVGTKVLIY